MRDPMSAILRQSEDRRKADYARRKLRRIRRRQYRPLGLHGPQGLAAALAFCICQCAWGEAVQASSGSSGAIVAPAQNGATQTAPGPPDHQDPLGVPTPEPQRQSPCSTGDSAFLRRQFDVAQPLLWLCVVSGERQPQDAVNLAYTYRDLHNYAEGQSRVTAEIEHYPSNEDLYYVAAYLLFRTQQFSQAIKELTAAYLMKQDDWRLHQLFAMIFVEQKDYVNAEHEFVRAIKLNPKNAEVYYQLSRLYYTDQRFSEAVAAAGRAIEIWPNYFEAYESLGLGYQANGDIKRAIESFSRAINLDHQGGNSDPWPYINFAMLIDSQSPASAIPLLQQAIAIDPRNADAEYYMGKSLRAIGQPEQAQQHFESAIQLDPACKSAYYALAALVRRRDQQRSAELMSKFKELLKDQQEQDHAGSFRACSQ